MSGCVCDTNIVASLDKKSGTCSIDPSKYNCWKVLETVSSHLKRKGVMVIMEKTKK